MKDVHMLLAMKQWIAVVVMPGNSLAVASVWVTVWLYRALLISLSGGVVGLLIAPVTKLLFFKQSTWLAVLKGGLFNGIMYAGIWASAIAFIWVIMDRKAIKRAVGRWFAQAQAPESSDFKA